MASNSDDAAAAQRVLIDGGALFTIRESWVTVPVGNGKLLIAANPMRYGLLLHNASANGGFISTRPDVVANRGFFFNTGGFYEWTWETVGNLGSLAWYTSFATGPNTITVVELIVN